MSKKLMVVGFLLNGLGQVLLIEKNRPEGYKGEGRPAWQQGLLNGAGGVCKEGQSPAARLVEKMKQEAGISTSESQWKAIGMMLDGDDVIYVMSAVVPDAQMKMAKSPTDEHVGIYHINKLGNYKVVPNLAYLVQFAAIEHDKQDARMMVSYNNTDFPGEGAQDEREIFYVVESTLTNQTKTISREKYAGLDIMESIIFAGSEGACRALALDLNNQREDAKGTTKTSEKKTSDGPSVNWVDKDVAKTSNATDDTPGENTAPAPAPEPAKEQTASTPAPADKVPDQKKP